MKSFLVRFPIVSYVILAFTISWTLWLPVVFSGPEMSVAVSVFHILGGLGPFAAALIMLKFSVDHGSSVPGTVMIRELSRFIALP